MAVVVTGAAGFLGTVLVEALLTRGERVVGIDRAPVPARPGLESIRADLLEAGEDTVAAFAAAEAVFHLAGCPGVRDSRVDAAWHRRRDNVLATTVVLGATPLHTPTIVTSSSSVYGGSRGRACSETDVLHPRGGYAESKVAVELLCRQRRCAGGLVAVARPFTVVGEGQRSDMAIARWIAAARAGQPLTVFGSPDRRRDVTDVRQAAEALIALADQGANRPVNIGTGVSRSLGELVAAVGRVLGLPVRTRVRPAAGDDVDCTLADPRRLRRLTGLELHTDLDDVVARAATRSRELEAVS